MIVFLKRENGSKREAFLGFVLLSHLVAVQKLPLLREQPLRAERLGGLSPTHASQRRSGSAAGTCSAGAQRARRNGRRVTHRADERSAASTANSEGYYYYSTL